MMGICETGNAGVMTLSGKQAPLLVALIAALLLVLAPAAQGAGQQASAQVRDAEKKKKARVKAFLMRAVEDMDRSGGFVNEIVALLEKQYDAAADTSDSEQRRKDLRDLLDWYQQYRVWLKGMASAVEIDLDEHFSRHEAGDAWISRYDKLAKGYHRLSRELSGNVSRLEKEQDRIAARIKKLEQAVQERRILIDKEELELSKELWPPTRSNPYDEREAVYKDLTDEEIRKFQRELVTLEEKQRHFESVTMLWKYERGWLSLKAGESETLYAVAKAINENDPVPLRTAYREAIRTYEADVQTLNRKVDEIKESVEDITRIGSLKALERLKDLTDYYEKMRTRFEGQSEWLQGQIGSYQVDLAEL